MRPFLAAGLVAIAFVSQGCLFGGDDDPDPTPTNAPSTATPTVEPVEDTTATVLATATAAAEETSTPDPSNPSEYTVKAGDFLSIIASKFGITVEALAAANDIDDPNKIFVGQVLIIPASE